jgi:TRAP-type C4-dicarboxylate transport system permease small subunit
MRRFLAAVEATAAFFLLLIALLTGGNVLLRDLFGVQIPDWFDGTRLLQAVALFWGIALATYRGSHICVDVAWEHLRAPGRRRMDLFATAVTFAFLAPMAWMVWVKVTRTGSQATMDLRLPMIPFYAVAAVGASVAVVLALWRLVELWRGRAPADAPGAAPADAASHGP